MSLHPGGPAELLAVERIRHPAGFALCVVHGEIDISNADDFRARLAMVVADEPAVVIDLTELRFLASAGLRVLFDVAVSEPDRTVAVVLGPTTRRIAEICGLATVARCHPDLGSAASAFVATDRYGPPVQPGTS